MSKEKVKLLWLSDSALSPTGFSNQTRNIQNRLVNDYTCFNLGHNYYGMPLIPPVVTESETFNFNILGGTPGMPYAKDMLPYYFDKVKPEIFGVLLDTFMGVMHGEWFLKTNIPAKSFWYFPSDGRFFPNSCERVLQKVDVPIAMAKFGRDQVKAQFGINAEYIPHGTDPNKFKPINEDEKRKLKARWGIPPDAFVVGANFRNQGRKMVFHKPRVLEAFFKKHPDAVALFNCDPRDVASANNLIVLCKRMGITHKVLYTGMQWFQGLPEDKVVEFYQMSDVNLSTTSGEGFGITTIEAMSCGVPSVITNYTTSRELITDHNAGYVVKLVGTDEEPYDHLKKWYPGEITGEWEVERGIMDANDCIDKLELIYNSPDKARKMGLNGRDAVLREYSWEVIMLQWKKLLAKLLQ